MSWSVFVFWLEATMKNRNGPYYRLLLLLRNDTSSPVQTVYSITEPYSWSDRVLYYNWNIEFCCLLEAAERWLHRLHGVSSTSGWLVSTYRPDTVIVWTKNIKIILYVAQRSNSVIYFKRCTVLQYSRQHVWFTVKWDFRGCLIQKSSNYYTMTRKQHNIK